MGTCAACFQLRCYSNVRQSLPAAPRVRFVSTTVPPWVFQTHNACNRLTKGRLPLALLRQRSEPPQQPTLVRCCYRLRHSSAWQLAAAPSDTQQSRRTHGTSLGCTRGIPPQRPPGAPQPPSPRPPTHSEVHTNVTVPPHQSHATTDGNTAATKPNNQRNAHCLARQS